LEGGNNIKVLVVEDEFIIADNICFALKDLGYEVLKPVSSYDRAIASIEKHAPDIVILDIQLAGKKDGIELAETINRNHLIPFIFLTSNADITTLDRIKNLQPVTFLVKPFRKEDLFPAIELTISNTQKTVDKESTIIKDALFIRSKEMYHKVKFSDIRYIKSDHVYMKIYTDEKSFLYRETFKKTLEEFPDYFFKTHKSYAINLNYLDSIGNNQVIVEGIEVPMSNPVKRELLKRINKK